MPPTKTKRDIQLASTRLPSTLDKGTRKLKPLPEGTATHPQDSGGNKQPLDRDTTSTTPNEGTAKTTPRPEGSLGDKDSGGNIPPTNMEPIHTHVADPSGTGAKYQVDETQSTRLRDDMDEDPYDDKEVRTPSPKQDQPEPSHVQESASDSSSPDLKKFDNILPLTERLDVITQLLKDINTAIKDDLATNQKINEATKTFAKISSNITEQEEASTAWMNSSTNMAWNLGSGISEVELSQTALKRKISSLRKDTSKIKSMMTEMYAAFRGQPSSAPSGSVTPTLSLTDIQANVKGKNANTTTTEEPPSYTKGETEEPRLAILISSIPSTIIPPTQAQPITSIIIHPESSQSTPKIDKGKGIATKSDDDPSKKLVKASSIVRPNPDEPVKVKLMINGKIVYISEQEIQDYWYKEEQIKKAEEEARLLEMTKPEAGEMFKKAQDAAHAVLKRQHTEKVKKSLELRKHKYDSYMWTVSSRLKPEPITDIKIHPKTKPVVITVYRGTDGR
ncbi:hypothetical protein Tco_1451462, partial [Tanacetum coccineum]